MKKVAAYFSKHPNINSLAHFSIGVGVGILLTRAVFDPHPVRWGVGLIALGLLLHVYPLTLKK